MTQALDPNPSAPGSAATPANAPRVVRSIGKRMAVNRAFVWLCLASTGLAILILAVLLVSVLVQGVGTLDLQFLRSLNSSDPSKAGIFSGLVGTVLLCTICALTAIPLGVGTAILIEEFRPRAIQSGSVRPTVWGIGLLAVGVVLSLAYLVTLGVPSVALSAIVWLFATTVALAAFLLVVKFLGKASVPLFLHGFIETNIRNLAGVPSIVYGILGVTAFATMGGLFGDMGAGKYAIGQTWFEEYLAEDRTAYYAPTDRGADPTPAASGMTLYTSMDLNEPAELTFIAAAEAEPRREAIEAEMDAFERALRGEIRDARVGGRRGPVAVDEQRAEQIVDAAIAAGSWESDPDELRADLLPMVAKLDGLEKTTDIVLARSEIIKTAVNREYATRMAGVMMVGREPVRRDQKAWYYLALPLGRGVMAGGLTLMLVVLPIVIVASQEALRAVPESYRQGALAMGATRWQSVSKTALPAAIPGICTGTILAISRAIGEAAPLLILGAVGYLTSTPKNPMDSFSAMPIQIYHWTSEPDLHYQHLAASGIIVLLAVLLTFNAVAIFIRQRAGRHA